MSRCEVRLKLSTMIRNGNRHEAGQLSSSLDVNVYVRHEIHEVSPSQADLYQGIYSVWLGSTFSILFVPAFERDPNNWPPCLPDDVDTLQNVQEARLVTALFADCAITPDAALAGEQTRDETLTLSNSEETSYRVVMFYLSVERFERIASELPRLDEDSLSVYDGVSLAGIADTALGTFLREQVLNSPHFADLPWLWNTK